MQIAVLDINSKQPIPQFFVQAGMSLPVISAEVVVTPNPKNNGMIEYALLVYVDMKQTQPLLFFPPMEAFV